MGLASKTCNCLAGRQWVVASRMRDASFVSKFLRFVTGDTATKQPVEGWLQLQVIFHFLAQEEHKLASRSWATFSLQALCPAACQCASPRLSPTGKMQPMASTSQAAFLPCHLLQGLLPRQRQHTRVPVPLLHAQHKHVFCLQTAWRCGLQSYEHHPPLHCSPTTPRTSWFCIFPRCQVGSGSPGHQKATDQEVQPGSADILTVSSLQSEG